MRVTFKFFNIRVGFFIEKRFSLLSFFNRIEFNKNYNKFKNTELDEWQYDAPVEKRLYALTSFKGLLHWLFRDVDLQCINDPDNFVLPIMLALEGTEKWCKNLINAGANEEQMYLYYNIAGTLFKESLDRILKTNPYLHECIFRSFKKDKLFRKLLENLD